MDSILYRYINWNDKGSKKLLTENELYLYSAQDWENDGEYDFKLFNFTQQSFFDKLLRIIINTHNTNFKEYEFWMNLYAQKYGIDLSKVPSAEIDLLDQYFCKRIAESRVSNPDVFLKRQKQIYFDRTGIFSLSETKSSYNLWNSKRNVSNDNVVCVGLDLSILRETLKLERNLTIREVNYTNDLPNFKLIEEENTNETINQLLNITFCIKLKFQQENEIRIQRLLIDNAIGSKERVIKLPNNIFKEIYMFENCEEEIGRAHV